MTMWGQPPSAIRASASPSEHLHLSVVILSVAARFASRIVLRSRRTPCWSATLRTPTGILPSKAPRTTPLLAPRTPGCADSSARCAGIFRLRIGFRFPKANAPLKMTAARAGRAGRRSRVGTAALGYPGEHSWPRFGQPSEGPTLRCGTAFRSTAPSTSLRAGSGGRPPRVPFTPVG